MSNRAFSVLASQDEANGSGTPRSDGASDEEPSEEETGGQLCCKVIGVWWSSLKTFIEGFAHAPQKDNFLSSGNWKLAKCIWFLLFIVFLATISLQIQAWIEVGSFPPIVTTTSHNRYFFAPNMELCNDKMEAAPIEIESVAVHDTQAHSTTPLVAGEDYFPVTDCVHASKLCDEVPPVACPIPDEYWPISPETGLRVTTGDPLSPLTGCEYGMKPCTRVFMRPTGFTKLPKSEKTGKDTELQITAYRQVKPQQWLFESRLMSGRCLVANGNQLHLGGSCEELISTNNLDAMFNFFAQSGESGVIKERGGQCLQSEAPKRTYASLTPCQFAGDVRYDPATGFLVAEGDPNMCLTEGEGRKEEMIKLHWGAEVVTTFKVFWQKCADRSNDPDTFSRQTFTFEETTGLVTSSITLPEKFPEAYCLVMSGKDQLWSAQTKLIVLIPCRFVRPDPKVEAVWWAKADAAIVAAAGGPAWMQLDEMQRNHTDHGHHSKKTVSYNCAVSAQVLPGRRLTGTSSWTCQTYSTSCYSNCGTCSPKCQHIGWIGDGNCNSACNVAECNFDCSDMACDCVAGMTAAGETVKATTEQAKFFRDNVHKAFHTCEDACGSFKKSSLHYLRSQWQLTGAADVVGRKLQLIDKFPEIDCPDSTTGTQGCYNQVYEALAGSAPPAGENATWCLTAYSGTAPLPMVQSEIIKIPLPTAPAAVALAECFPQLNSQRYYYQEATGHVMVKGGGCLFLNSGLVCTDVKTLGQPKQAVATIMLQGKFSDLAACGKAVQAARAAIFTHRDAVGATYWAATQGCAAHMEEVDADTFSTDYDMCHLHTESDKPIVGTAICDTTDPRQQWQVTPQQFFSPAIAFAPPQTRTIVKGWRLFFRVMYSSSGLKGMVDTVVKTLHLHGKFGWNGFWGQSMPLELMMPGLQVWDKSAHTATSRNQLYRITVDPVGYGARVWNSLDMPWSMTGEDIRFAVRSSDMVIRGDPLESLRVERVYLHVAYSAENVVHHIATADMITKLSTMVAVLIASAGLLKCWQHAFPLVGEAHMTVQGHILSQLQTQAASIGIEPDDMQEVFGIDVPAHLHMERKPCCPCLFSQDDALISKDE